MKNTTMMRKMGAAALALTLAFGLTACSGSGAGTTSSVSSAGSTTQTGGETYKVGIVKFMDHASLDQIESSLQESLDALGAEKQVTFDYADYTYNGQGDASTLTQIAAQLISDEVDVIVPIATPAAQVMLAALEDEEIPLVFSAVSDPITDGMVQSMEAPGVNVTGTSDALNTEMIINLMLAVNPEIKSVGILYSNSESSSTKPVQEAEAFLTEKGIQVVKKSGTTTDEVNSAVDALIDAKVDAIFTPTDNTVMQAELAIYEKLQEAGIPHYAGADSFALNGAFCGYGVNYVQLGQETAEMVSEVLVDGADPAVTPVRIMTGETATVNTETCEAIGLNLDDVKAAFSGLGIEVVETTTAESFS